MCCDALIRMRECKVGTGGGQDIQTVGPDRRIVDTRIDDCRQTNNRRVTGVDLRTSVNGPVEVGRRTDGCR